jgi:hypothetical protein
MRARRRLEKNQRVAKVRRFAWNQTKINHVNIYERSKYARRRTQASVDAALFGLGEKSPFESPLVRKFACVYRQSVSDPKYRVRVV